MKTRILSAVIAIPLALLVLFLPPVATGVAVALLGCIAMLEIVQALQIKNRAVMALAVLFGGVLPLWFVVPGSYWYLWMFSVILWYTLLLALFAVLFHDTLSVGRVGLLYLMSLLVGGGFAALAYLRGMPHGLFYVIVALVMAWTGDTGAYFAGTLFGKHKLCPTISPKKTVEGLIGGIAVDVLCCLLTGFIYTLIQTEVSVKYGWLALLALVGSLLAVFGDLFASVVKRRFGVKDYGRIMPGHGGVMDRFDSVLPVALFVCWALMWLPLI